MAEHITNEQIEQLFNLADEIVRAPSRFEKRFVIEKLGLGVADLCGVIDRLRAQLAEIGEMPRPYLAAAMAEAKPEMRKQLEEAWSKAVAEWDGRLTVVELPKIVAAEWGVRWTDQHGETRDDAKPDEAAARHFVEVWQANLPDYAAGLICRTKAGDWHEVTE